MEKYNLVVIALFLSIVSISGLLNWAVLQHISKKPLIDQTVLDLTYKECLLYIFLLACSLCIAFISCLMTNENALGFVPAILCSNLVFFFIFTTSNSLSVGCILRILTMIYNSEQQGLQLLGTDDEAITKIRALSMAFSTCTIIIGNLILNSFPPIFIMLVGNQNLSIASMVKQDPGIIIYFILPVIATALVISTNIVTN